MTKKRKRTSTAALQLKSTLRKLIQQHGTEEVLRQLANAFKAEDREDNYLVGDWL